MKLSIITINYNNLYGLKKTIDSVIYQDFNDFEWIIVDGGSTDGSFELIEQYKECFSFWCSEPDKGVYNAMNKGITHAHGDYVQFLNSGDWLFESTTLEKVFSHIDSTYDVYYGDMVPVEEEKIKRATIFPDELGFTFFAYKNICHQAVFYKRHLFDNNPYDETYSIVSDWVMNLQLLFRGCTFKHLNQKIVYYDLSGISAGYKPQLHIEHAMAYEKHVPQQIKIDIERYEKNFHFSRRRRSTRWIVDNTIRFCHWLDRKLSKLDSSRWKLIIHQ